MGICSKIKLIKQPAIFLDRDGVINEPVIIDGKPYPPANLNELVLIDGIEDFILKIKNAGFLVLVVTNQPDVGRGKTPLKFVDEIHDYLKAKFAIDKVYCCFHDDSDKCNCRKPKPGMILTAINEWNIDITKSFLIGDRWRDIESARNANITSILIDYGYNEKLAIPDFKCNTIKEAIKFII